jgi:hypothetical protein
VNLIDFWNIYSIWGSDMGEPSAFAALFLAVWGSWGRQVRILLWGEGSSEKNGGKIREDGGR